MPIGMMIFILFDYEIVQDIGDAVEISQIIFQKYPSVEYVAQV